MKDVFLKILRLMIGLFLYAFGIVISINTQEGLAPWHVFHQRLSFQINWQNLQNSYHRSKLRSITELCPFGEQISLKRGTHVASYGVFNEESNNNFITRKQPLNTYSAREFKGLVDQFVFLGYKSLSNHFTGDEHQGQEGTRL
jgi:hypothetical protein